MNLLRIDHTAVAVIDLDEALNRYALIFGLEPSERVTVPDQKVEVAFLPLGDTQIELIQPMSPDSTVSRFLARRGEGLHHIGVAVNDIQAELERLRRDNVELIDLQPRPGVHGRIAFLHPRSTGGVLVELVEIRHA